MRFILRLVAIVVMLMALTEAVLAVVDYKPDSEPRSAEGSSEYETRTESPRPSWTDKFQKYLDLLHNPAFFFCEGAILFMLVRISSVQDQDRV